MALYDEIYSRLTGHGGTAALIGTRATARVLPQAPTLPAVAFQQVSRVYLPGQDEIEQFRWQFDCYAGTYREAVALAVQVRDALHEWRDGTATPKVINSRCVNETDGYSDNVNLFSVVVDVLIVVVA